MLSGFVYYSESALTAWWFLCTFHAFIAYYLLAWTEGLLIPFCTLCTILCNAQWSRIVSIFNQGIKAWTQLQWPWDSTPDTPNATIGYQFPKYSRPNVWKCTCFAVRKAIWDWSKKSVRVQKWCILYTVYQYGAIEIQGHYL